MLARDSKKSKLEENEMISSKLFGYPNNMRPGQPSSRDVLETCIIKNLITSYFSVVKKNINDLVPKTIMCFLVNQSKMMAEKEMVSQLYKSNDLESLLQEDPIIGTQRKHIKDQLIRLKNSMDVLNHFYAFSRYDS
jgi:dynamin 1-like protein